MLKEIFYPIYEVHTAGNGKEGFEQALTIQPDIVLSDVMMPEMSGKEMCYKIKNTVNLSHIPVVLLTAQTSVEYTIEGYMYEADDYITKPFGVMELISRVKALLRRTQSAAEKTKICHGEIRMDNDKHAVFVGDEPCELTFKEYELLKYLMINAGIVLSRDKIMDQVWGFEYEGESRTVDMHIKTLRQKLGAAGSCIKTIRNVGYMIEWTKTYEEKIKFQIYVDCGNRHSGDCRMFYRAVLQHSGTTDL